MPALTSRAESLGEHAERLRLSLLALGCLGLSLAAGSGISTRHGTVIAVYAAIIGALVAATLVNRGLGLGLLVLAVLNGIPALDLELYTISGRFRASDVIIVSLVALLALGHLAASRAKPVSRGLGLVRLWSAVFLAWWLFTVIRTVVWESVPLVEAALFGRDFLFFALLVPLLAETLRTRREAAGFVTMLSIGAALYGIGQIAETVFHADLPWLVHESLTREIAGIVRIYAPMNDAVIAALPFLLTLAILTSSFRVRLLAGGGLLVLAPAALLHFSRATYGSLLAGLLLAFAVMLIRSRRGRFLPGRIVLVAAIVAAAVVAFASFRSATEAVSPVDVAAMRVQSGFDEVATLTGNAGYRVSVGSTMLDRLGNDWMIGLGFLHPSSRPVGGLPDSSIRNGDLGVLNGVMTMGVVGTALLYLPLVLVAALLLLGRRRADEREAAGLFEGIRYGAAAWLVTALVGSITLVTLFSVSGLVLTAAIVAVSVRFLLGDERVEVE